MQDLTVIYLTLNRMPPEWVKFHSKHLLFATQGHKLMSISKEPLDFCTGLIDTESPSYNNIYKQILRGAKQADTKYIGIAEDDTLYSPEHYNQFRPKDDEFGYNRARWSLFTWTPIYSLRQRISNCSLIAPRELLIEALEERFTKYPDGVPLHLAGECGRNKLEKRLGITERKAVDFFSGVPIVQLSHEYATEDRQKRKRKKLAQIKALNIPYWGKGEDIINNLTKSR